MRKPNTCCSSCGTKLYRRPFELKKWESVFCESCRNAGMSGVAKKGWRIKYSDYIDRWKKGLETGFRKPYFMSKHIVRYLKEKNNCKCEKCGWGETNEYTNTIPLEVHHKDGNYFNNLEDNLMLLCPNCHSLTKNNKGANKGKGRNGRLV